MRYVMVLMAALVAPGSALAQDVTRYETAVEQRAPGAADLTRWFSDTQKARLAALGVGNSGRAVARVFTPRAPQPVREAARTDYATFVDATASAPVPSRFPLPRRKPLPGSVVVPPAAIIDQGGSALGEGYRNVGSYDAYISGQ